MKKYHLTQEHDWVSIAFKSKDYEINQTYEHRNTTGCKKLKINPKVKAVAHDLYIFHLTSATN